MEAAHYQEKIPTGNGPASATGPPQYHQNLPYSPDTAYQHAQPRGETPMQPVPQHHHPQQPVPQHMGPTAYGQQGGEWQESLCRCTPVTSCLLAWCLPCILVGQTSERIRDPSMQSADMMNSDCLVHGAITCFTGCGWIYSMLKRNEIRERYNIKGSGMSDCCVSYWCPCCAIIQQDNEVKTRQKNQVTTQAYQPQAQMQMPAPTYHPQQ